METKGSDGCSYQLSFRYEVIDAPRRLVFTDPNTGLTTDIGIRGDGTGTDVVVRQRRLPPDLQTEQAREGLAGILRQLDVVVGELVTRRQKGAV